MSSDLSALSEPTSIAERPQPSTATSRSLLDRVKADDAAAWDRLVGLYAPLVYRWCRRWDLPEQEIADIFQDVFQAVATHIAGFRKDGPATRFAAGSGRSRGTRCTTISGSWDGSRAGPAGPTPRSGSRGSPHAEPPMTMMTRASESRERLVGRALELIRGEFEIAPGRRSG